jgi:GWxTD domain-containing protein
MVTDRPRPTSVELEILTVLWSIGLATVREVYDVISRRRLAQYSTVLKFMQIMAEKGLVRRDEKQRAHVYEAARPREWTQQQLGADLMERVFSGSAKALLMGALSARKATKDAAVATFGNAHEHAVALATLEQNRWSGRGPAVAVTGGSLVKRIRRLLYPQGTSSFWAPFFAAIVLVTTAVVAFAVWPPEPPQQSSAAAQRQKDRAESSAYDEWLNEDVVYIIADKERAAFQKLTTNEERDKFIEQFWEQRNPNPGSATNKFKEGHYRRIAYANEHYASNTRAGWRTDRGHMYILYGPPDEVDSHPAGPPYPFEEWRYRHVEGLGINVILTFIDPTGNGDYRLAPAHPVKKN